MLGDAAVTILIAASATAEWVPVLAWLWMDQQYRVAAAFAPVPLASVGPFAIYTAYGSRTERVKFLNPLAYGTARTRPL